MARVLSAIPLVMALFLHAICFAETGEERVPVYTDDDLKRYGDQRTAVPEKTDSIPGDDTRFLSQGPLDREAILRENGDSVVAVIAYGEDGRQVGHGSGFVLTRDGLVVTSHHIVTRAASVKIRLGRRIIPVEGVVVSDRENDVVVLKAQGEKFRTVRPGETGALGPGERVYVISNPGGEGNMISEGVFIGSKEVSPGKSVLQVSAAFGAGSSGGPVFNENGEVIGVATYLIRDVKDLHFAVPLDSIREKLPPKEAPLVKGFLHGEGSSADYWIGQADALSKSGRLRDAIEAYEKALSVDPESAAAYGGLGNTSMTLGRYNDAVKAYRKALDLGPGSALIHSNLGLVYGELGRYEEALVELKKAIAVFPDLAIAHSNLGLTYKRLRRYREAAEAYQEAVRIRPDFADARFELGIVYLDLNDKKAALEEYRALKDLNPTLAERLLTLINR